MRHCKVDLLVGFDRAYYHLTRFFQEFCLMGWRMFFYSLFILLNVVESSSRSGKMWLLNQSSEATSDFSWTILSAGVFVLVAVVLSVYLIIEHLAYYNQPEVCCIPSLDWNSKD